MQLVRIACVLAAAIACILIRKLLQLGALGGGGGVAGAGSDAAGSAADL
jgi:hypothetical protein